MSIVLTDSDILSIVKKHETVVYLLLDGGGDCMTQISMVKETQVIPELYGKYCGFSDEFEKSRRYYLRTTADRMFTKMIRDCRERLDGKTNIASQLNHLKSLVLPVQRSSEWYQMRETMLTASSLADALGKGHFRTKEALLIEKTNSEKTPFFTNDIIQWGVKYEPVATSFYEHLHKLTIVEFGLVPHPNFPIFGASPDGICDTDAPPSMVGRMLEIKCPPKRNFTSEVPFHYWIQMQGQLETCGLEECDFLQVKLEEYSSEEMYRDDICKLPEDEIRSGYTKSGYPKGLLLTFISSDKEGNPNYVYEYCPLFTSYEGCLSWKQTTLKQYEDHYDVVRENWWFIRRYECTLVLRDRDWWRETMPQIIDFWQDVVHYRSVGNKELIDKRDARKQKRRITMASKKSKMSPRSLNIIKIDQKIVEQLQTDNFLDTDSDSGEL
jgi:putative phage-type endonuclease